MTPPFKNIGKRINDFLQTKEYDLNRTAQINVSSDKVSWSLENKLNKNGSTSSALEVSHKFEKETLSLKSSTTKAPKFAVKTNRLQSYFAVKASIQDPVMELNLSRNSDKYALDIDSTFDWDGQKATSAVAVAYSGVDSWLLGAKAKVERSSKNGASSTAVTDYNVGLQYTRSKDQTFAVTTENQLGKIKVGADVQVRDGYRGFAEVSYLATQEDADKAKSSPVGYAVGLQRTLSPSSSIRGVYRSDSTASLLYTNNFAASNVCTKIACNINPNQPVGQRYNLQWKIVFGK